MESDTTLISDVEGDRVSDEISFSFAPNFSSTPPNSPSPIAQSNKTKTVPVDIILADATLKQIEIDSRANGQECLEKILSVLGVFQEIDYFGLAFYGAKQELLWVNMRNRLFKQVSNNPAICRLYLRVKFYVQPHMLLQDETRHLLFLDVSKSIREEAYYTEELSEHQKAELMAFFTQAEFGDFNVASTPLKYQRYWRGDSDIPAEVIAQVAEIHRTLVGLPRLAAENHILRVASKLATYGMHFHEVKDCYENKMNIAVGPSAICLCKDNRMIIDRYPYPRVQKVTISDRVLYLSLSQENGSVKEVGYRLVSQRAAHGLYRCVTEMHSFFRCDTVRTDVSTQTCRDIKGTLVSFFIEHEGGIARDFVFDIRRTAREVYDDARRRLHVCSSAANTPTSSVDVSSSTAFPFDFSTLSACESELSCCPKLKTSGPSADVIELQQRLVSLEKSRQCNVCMDNIISVVFIPCGHLVCCKECSERVTACPVCRLDIAVKQTCFAPWSS